MSAAELAHALGGQRVGPIWTARCPAHNDRIPSVSIGEGNDGKPLVHRHAGCGQAEVIAALQGPADQQHYKTFRPPPALRCDAAARVEINNRIARLVAAKEIVA